MTRARRPLFSLALLGIAGTALPVLADMKVPVAPAPGRVVLLGLLTRQFRQVCEPREKGGLPDQVKWVDPRLEVGWVPLVGDVDAATDALVGKLVLVEGAAGSAADVRWPADALPGCGLLQARSDWVAGKDGIRLRRDRSPAARAIPALRPAAAREYTGFSVRRVGERIRVHFQNDTGQVIRRFVMTLHYEGCFGKPMPESVENAAGDIGPGGSVDATFPAVLWKTDGPTSRRHYAAHSVRLDGDGAVVFDVDVPTPRVECPK